MPTVLPGAIIQAALDNASARLDGVRLVGRTVVDIPQGDYYVSETIVADGVVDPSDPSKRLACAFDLNFRGVTLWQAPGVDVFCVRPRSSYSILRGGLFVVGASPKRYSVPVGSTRALAWQPWAVVVGHSVSWFDTEADAIEAFPNGPAPVLATDHGYEVGLDIQAHHVVAEDVFIREMGVPLRACGSQDIGANANCTHVRGATLFAPLTVGLHAKGGDCNAGTFEGVEIIGASKVVGGASVPATDHGVLDEAFLGNRVPGAHISSTRSEAVKITPAANYSTYEAAYLEENCGSELPSGAAKIASKKGATWLGGNAPANVRIGERIGGGATALSFRGVLPDGQILTMTIPAPDFYAYFALVRQFGSSENVEAFLERKKNAKTIDFKARKSGAVARGWGVGLGTDPTAPLGTFFSGP